MSIKNSVSNVGGPNDFIPPNMAFEAKSPALRSEERRGGKEWGGGGR